MRLIAITREGRPADEVGPLHAVAEEAMAATAVLYGAVGYVPPWIAYLARERDVVVGTCAFKGPPSDGRVEIAYFTFPPNEGRGIATAMARTLIDLATAAQPRTVITAQTKPEPNVSNAILRKLGFASNGSVMSPEDGEVWEWVLSATKTERA